MPHVPTNCEQAESRGLRPTHGAISLFCQQGVGTVMSWKPPINSKVGPKVNDLTLVALVGHGASGGHG